MLLERSLHVSRGALRFEAVSFVYESERPGTPALRLSGIDFAVEAGSSLAIVGPNGSGKTTILRLAAGELAPPAGASRSAASIRRARRDATSRAA